MARAISWPENIARLTVEALQPLSDPIRAEGAASYMKHIAPFLGITAPERRAALKLAWRNLPIPTSNELGQAAALLFAKSEREYHYAAFDLIQLHVEFADETFLAEYLEQLIATKSWWDTVDGLVTAGVSPLCWRYDATDIIHDWSESENMWLIRAAIGHQRGWKSNTEVEEVFSLCDRHWENKEFFVSKAIGWALRDITNIDPSAVRKFLALHPTKNAVAEREANRGLDRT